MDGKSRFIAVAALFGCFLFLAGCSSMPILVSPGYIKDLYKRIPYKTEGSYRVIDIFYATSREIKGERDSLKSFRPRLGEKLSYGTLNVKIDPRLTIGKMLPGWFRKKGVIGVQRVEELGDSTFMEELSEAVGNSPHKSLLVGVFGYKDNFENTAIKAAYFAYSLDGDTPVLLFDWPGDQSVTPWGYYKAQSLARDSGAYLGRLLARIIREIKPEKLWVESSSLGCQVVCDAFEEMYKHEDLADAETEIDQVVLSAPDVSENEFDENFQNEITTLSRHLTTYVASDDEALLLSGIIDGEKKLGRKKVRVKEQDQAAEARDLLYLKSLAPDKIAIVDVTPINKVSYKHGYYLEAPEFFDDLYLRLFDRPPHVNRRLYLLKVEGDVDYWVLQSGKR